MTLSKQRRKQLIDEYVERTLDGMDIRDLAQLAGDYMAANLSRCTDEELLGEIEYIFPDMISQDTPND